VSKDIQCHTDPRVWQARKNLAVNVYELADRFPASERYSLTKPSETISGFRTCEHREGQCSRNDSGAYSLVANSRRFVKRVASSSRPNSRM